MSNHKALATALISSSFSTYKNEFNQDEVTKLEFSDVNNTIIMSEKTLKHRCVIGVPSGIKKLLNSNSNHVVGVSDFKNKKPVEPGLYCINSIKITTSEEIDENADDGVLASANFRSAVTSSDAPLLSGILRISVEGSQQPPIEVYIGDVMPKASPQFPRGDEYTLSQGIIIPMDKSVNFELEFNDNPATKFTEGKSKAMEISLIGMKVKIN